MGLVTGSPTGCPGVTGFTGGVGVGVGAAPQVPLPFVEVTAPAPEAELPLLEPGLGLGPGDTEGLPEDPSPKEFPPNIDW
jgi:hypothetical protein